MLVAIYQPITIRALSREHNDNFFTTTQPIFGIAQELLHNKYTAAYMSAVYESFYLPRTFTQAFIY